MSTRTVTRVLHGGVLLLLAFVLMASAAAGALGGSAAPAGSATAGSARLAAVRDASAASARTSAGAAGVTTARAVTSYARTIREGRAAAQQLLDASGAASLSLALVSGERVVWLEAFGYADKATKTAPAADTRYGIGSVSKMFAAAAVMKLVDQGKVRLDDPLVKYVPSFGMATPTYRQITVRMLLDHSAGLPGSCYGDASTGTYFPGYLQKVMDTLARERLKTTPGLISVYSNDGFTLTEALVAAVTGTSYAAFVHDEILAPLGMEHSAYPLQTFPDGSYAKVYDEDTPRRFEVLNAFASGGLYSTAADMARFGAMFIGGGAYEGTRILSADAVTEMAENQVTKNFDPVPSTQWNYGLGWDTVTTPGLAAVGVTGCTKGGDSGDYHAAFTVARKARLAVAVLGVAPLDSGRLEDLAEDILIHALVDQKTIKRLPKPVSTTPPPVRKATPAQLEAAQGVWAYNTGLVRITKTGADPQDLTFAQLGPDGWAAGSSGWTLRSDGLFHCSLTTSALGATSAGGRQYLIYDTVAANGFYRNRQALWQKLLPEEQLSQVWQDRVGQTYLAVNAQPDSIAYTEAGAVTLTFGDIPGLSGYVTVTTPDYGTTVADAAGSDDRASMCLQIPGLGGRDLEDAIVEAHDGQDWVWWGDTLYRPTATMPELATGANRVTIGSEGYAEWRAVEGAATVTVTTLPHGPLDGAGAAGLTEWILFGPDTAPLTRGSSFPATVAVPASGGFLLLFGSPGSTATVTTTPAGD